MIKYIPLICLLSLLAPTRTDAQWRIGVLGGVNYVGINPYTIQYFDGTSSATTFHKEFFTYRFNAGLQFDFKLGKALHFHPDLLYTQKGYIDHSISGLNQSNPLQISQTFINYLDAPLNIVYGTPLGKGKVYVGGGPYLAYGLSGTSRTHSAGGYVTDPYWTFVFKAVFDKDGNFSPPNRTFGVNRWDYGINGLIGYEFNFGLSLDFRYEMCMRDIYYHDMEILGATKFNVFSLNAGFLLPPFHRR